MVLLQENLSPRSAVRRWLCACLAPWQGGGGASSHGWPADVLLSKVGMPSKWKRAKCHTKMLMWLLSTARHLQHLPCIVALKPRLARKTSNTASSSTNTLNLNPYLPLRIRLNLSTIHKTPAELKTATRIINGRHISHDDDGTKQEQQDTEMSEMDTNEATESEMDTNKATDNEEAPPNEVAAIDGGAQQDENDADDGKRQGGYCGRWMLSHRLGWLYRLPGQWPRTFALIFGVVSYVCY